MSYVFKRKFPFILVWVFLLLGSIIGRVDADYMNPGLSNCGYVSPCEPVCLESCCDEWIVNADLLYWRALQNGLGADCGSEIKDHWDLGCRVGFEYDSASTCWDVIAFWTHLHNNSSRGSHDEDRSHWKFNYDTVDVLLGRDFNCNACFSYTPYIGLRGAWIDEKLKSEFGDCFCESDSSCGSSCDSSSGRRSSSSGFSGFSGDYSSSFGGGFNEQHLKEKFWGVGPEIGIKADWKLGCDFSLYGNIGFGFLYGQFKVKTRFHQFFSDSSDCGSCHFSRHIRACQAIADAGIGIEWKRCLCNNMEAIVRLGFEHHRYFNQNHIGGYGDLCLDGVTLSGGIKF